MKQVAIVCNNYREFAYFVETLQWKLSKENKPYRSSNNCIFDVYSNTKYFHIPCRNEQTFQEHLQGMECDDYILMCGITDQQLMYLNSKIRREKL